MAGAEIVLSPTQRGFLRAEFTDRYGEKCSIQKSSLAFEDCIWLGVNEHRMHLTQEQAKALIPHLHHFVKTGEL
jgi:hypothetical protein